MNVLFTTPKDLLLAKMTNDKERAIVDAALLGLCETEYPLEHLITIKHELEQQHHRLRFKFILLCN